MKIVIRTDASVDIGSGHVMRCMVLANELRTRGHDVSFAVRPLPGNLIDFIHSNQFHVIQLSEPELFRRSSTTDDYATWLQVTPQEDADEFCDAVLQAELVIVDHYALDEVWEENVVNKLKCKILAIDDLVRKHKASLVLDQTLDRSTSAYPNVEHALTGTSFALLKPRFSEIRETLGHSKSGDEGLIKILISMGGVDQPNATFGVLKALVGASFRFKATVLLSPRAPHYSVVTEFCKAHTYFEHVDFVDDMASLMSECDLAIGAPGTTSWERACLGLPNIIVPLAANQSEISEKLVAHEATICLSLDSIENELVPSIEVIIERYDHYQKNNLTLCDGKGVFRVVNRIESVLRSKTGNLRLVPASTSDIEQVYAWQIHPSTRKYALNPSIPTFSEHQNWMSKKLEDKESFFYIIRDDHVALGGVRLDPSKKDSEEYTISIYIDPDFFGRGIAKSALRLVEKKHHDISILATVKKDNIASQKLFESADYQRLSDETFIKRI